MRTGLVSATKGCAAAAALTITASVLAACGSADASGDGNTTPASSAEVTAAQAAWAADYIHGTAGTAADSSKAPVVLGYINQQGGTFDFSEATSTAQATADFINKELGGVDGSPVELHTCFVATPEDVQKCGAKLANDDEIKAVIAPALYISNGVFYSALKGKVPIFMNGLTFPEDFTTPNLFSFGPSSASSAMANAFFMADTLGVKRVAIIRTDNDAGLAGLSAYKGIFEAMGVEIADVAVPEPGTAPEYASALAQAKIKDGDGVLPVLTSLGCANVYDALKAQKLKPIVLGSTLCAAAPMPDRLKSAGQKNTTYPEGWYMSTNGYNPLDPQPNTNGLDVMQAVVLKYVGDDANWSGYSPSAFAEMLSAVRFVQEAGGTAATSDLIAAKAKAFTGPAATVAGEIACGSVPTMPNACAFTMGLSQFKDGQWVSVADATNGKALDTRTLG